MLHLSEEGRPCCGGLCGVCIYVGEYLLQNICCSLCTFLRNRFAAVPCVCRVFRRFERARRLSRVRCPVGRLCRELIVRRNRGYGC